MGDVEFLRGARPPSAFQALLASAPALLDAMPGGVCLCRADGAIIRYNREAAALWGREPRLNDTTERFCGAHARFLLDGRPLAPEDTPMAKALATGQGARNVEVVVERPDGSRRTALVNIQALFDADGAVEGAINCFQDITERRAMQEEIARGKQDLEDFFENSAVGLHIVAADGTILRANRAELDLLGYKAEEYVGHHIAEFHADAYTIGDMLRRLSQGERLDHYPARLRAKDGTIKHVLVTSNGRFENGQMRNTRCFTLDVTGMHAADTARRVSDARLAESERRLRAIIEALPAAIYTTDAEGRVTFYNKAAIELSGRTPELGRDLWCVTWRLYHPDGRPLPHEECPMAVALKEDRAIRGVEAVAERPDGTRVPILPYPTPLHDWDGRLTGAINMLVDISERKEAETRQRALIDELNHRVKNTLSTVQSLAAQTARQAETPADFVQTFEGRLMALSRAHDLLTRAQWEGADLGATAGAALAPYAEAAPGRVRLDGPAVWVSPRTALALTMALHELATNAARYGALAGAEGQLTLRWAVREGVPPGEAATLELDWTEHGPNPAAAPARRGFGTRLVERMVQHDLGGDLTLDFAAEGVRCHMAVPLPRHGNAG